MLAAIVESTRNSQRFAKLDMGIANAGFADLDQLTDAEVRQLLTRTRTDPQYRDCNIVRIGLRFALDQMLCPSDTRVEFIKVLQPDLLRWIRWGQASLGLPLTPFIDGEWGDEVNDPALPQMATTKLQPAISKQREAVELLNELIHASFGNRTRNPLVDIVRSVHASRSARAVVVDELLSISILRLYSRIDAYKPKPDGSFLGWWRTLVDRCLLDMLEARRLPIPLQDEQIGTLVGSDENQEFELQPFDDGDWQTIQGWAKHNVMISIVVCTGFGWFAKVKANPSHWREFCEWLLNYGIEDADSLWDAMQECGWTTAGQLGILAEHACRKANSVRQSFHRSFSGIQQTARQTSFGKMHHAVELDYYWKARPFYSARLHNTLREMLLANETDARVAALCCAPAWQLVGGLSEWVEIKEDYPFQIPPPLFEFLKPDLDIKPEHRSLLPPWVRSNVDKVAYIREKILAHGTVGGFEESQTRVRQARISCVGLEAELRMHWEDTEVGGQL